MKALRKHLAAAVIAALPLVASAQTTPPPATTPAPETKPAETTPPAAPATPAPAAKPATPPPPPVQVYGTFNVNFHYAETSGATGAGISVGPRFVISADSSNVGVRGTLKLSDAVSATYQCETGANIEGEALASLCNRNSRVGLTGMWGTFAYGNWDTPMKSQHYGTKADDPFGNTDVFGQQSIMGSPGYAVKTGAINQAQATTGTPAAANGTTAFAGFDTRGGNSVLWWTPKFAGFTGRLQWGVDEFKTAEGLVDPMFLAAGLTYELGNLAIVGAYEYREDFFGMRTISGANASNRAEKDQAWRISAGYDLPLGGGTLNVMGMFEQLIYNQDNAPVATTGTSFSEYSRLAWLVGTKFRTGNHEFRLRYSQALDPDITAVGASANEDDLGAQHWVAGYAYHLAKSTQVYLFYSQLLNDDRARYTFGVAGAAVQTVGGGSSAVNQGVAAGAELLAFGLGMRHAF